MFSKQIKFPRIGSLQSSITSFLTPLSPADVNTGLISGRGGFTFCWTNSFEIDWILKEICRAQREYMNKQLPSPRNAVLKPWAN